MFSISKAIIFIWGVVVVMPVFAGGAEFKGSNSSLNQRYNLTVDSKKIIEDFKSYDDQGKYNIVRYLLKHEIYEEEILKAVEAAVLSSCKTKFNTKVEYAPLAHMCKYLSSSKMPQYRATLEEVHLNAGHKNIKKYAKKFLMSYYGKTYD